MKNLLKYKSIIFFITTLVLISSCCECEDVSNPDCPNYDPCHNSEEPQQAIFGAGYVYHIGEGNSKDFFTDTTIYLNGDTIPATTTFYALNTDVDSFYWQIGQDPRIFTSEQVYIEFDEQYNHIPIEVSYTIVKYNDCFDDGVYRETVKRTVVPSVNPGISTYFTSKYIGTSTEQPNEEFTIEIDFEHRRILNFPKTGIKSNSYIFYNDYDEIYFTAGRDSVIWLANLKITKEDRRKVIIRYKISYDLGATSQWHTFEGIRVD